jgi:hypothetical protein
MWIKEPAYPLHESSNDRLNFLYQSDIFYIMDNHLAASWCWLQQIDIENSYNLYHIDKHYDLLDSPESVRTQITETDFDLSNCSLDEYLGLRQSLRNGDTVPLFRYDNYILNLQLVYESIFNKKIFATHHDGNSNEDFIDPENGDYEKEDYEIVGNLSDDVVSNRENKWIINLDLDYFFLDNDEYYQHLSDKYIKELCKNIKESIENISVVTISLSPECCGGWKNSYRIARMIAKYFRLDFKLEIE